MVVILVLSTFALIIIVRLLLDSKRRKVVQHVPAGITTSVGPGSGAKYLHPAYSWLTFEKPTLAKVGIIDFVKELVGRLDGIVLPQKGTSIDQGEPMVTLKHGTRTLTLYSPLSGIIFDVNQRVAKASDSPDGSPYENGWILKIVPNNLGNEKRTLMRDTLGKIWQEGLRFQLMQLFAPKLGPVLQDGGSLVENFQDTLSDAQWNRLVSEFFPEPEKP